MDNNTEILQQLIDEGEQFTFANFCYPSGHGSDYGGQDAPEWLAWKTRARNLVSEINSNSSAAVKLATGAASIATEGNSRTSFERAKATYIKSLQLTLDAVENDAFGELRTTDPKSKSRTQSKKVFIVHGHDNALKTDVERFIHQIGLEPVVLHREADKGRTIIEKFEEHSDVSYAFILLTPDEIAYTVDQDSKDDGARKKERRARPNVIFEFGYFVGKLGRERVCCLHKGGVELPTDVSGIIYKPVSDNIDTQGFSIMQELQEAGFDVKLTRAKPASPSAQ